MKKVLIIIDDTVQAGIAVGAFCEYARPDGCEVVLLTLKPPPRDWLTREVPDGGILARAEARTQLALHQAWQLLDNAGAYYKTHVAVGDFASTVVDIAHTEGCDHIILSRRPDSFFSRTLFALTGLRIASVVEDVMALAQIPVTVIASASPGQGGCLAH